VVSDFEFVCSHRALTSDHYWFDLDEYRRGQDTFLLAHLRFDRFTPSIMRRVLREWSVFRKCVTAPLFALGEVDDEKWARFVSLLGFRFHQQVHCINGATRRLFIHTDGHASRNN
jgi:hypothetical protein